MYLNACNFHIFTHLYYYTAIYTQLATPRIYTYINIAVFLKVISEAFKGIFKVFTTILKSICDAIAYFFTHFLEPVISSIKKVTSAFNEIGTVVHHIEDVFAPIKWVLEAIEWIFEMIVQPVIDDIMDVSYIYCIHDSLFILHSYNVTGTSFKCLS